VCFNRSEFLGDSKLILQQKQRVPFCMNRLSKVA
jgi:hypothetical protein